jgi:hypothetical protein
MATAISFTFNGRECFARELTARQIDQVIGGPSRRLASPAPAEPKARAAKKDTSAKEDPAAKAADPGFHIFDLLFYDEPVSSLAATLSTGIPLDELDGDVSPVELETVMQAVKEANPFLVRAVNNGARMAKDFEERLAKILASRSGAPPTS